MNKKVSNKTIIDIANEWNLICGKRDEIIGKGKDISLTCVTLPCIISNLKENAGYVLDLGCGTGYVTNQIAQHCKVCYGIDASSKSIEISQNKYNHTNIVFERTTISNFKTNIKFDVCVANMVFMTDPDMSSSLENVFRLLKDDGVLLATITHPCFWPIYWGYFREPWFDYNSEQYIQHDFATSLSTSIGITTHIHRPLSMYFEIFNKAGFRIEKLEELKPVCKTPQEYSYEYPRFVFLKAVKIK